MSELITMCPKDLLAKLHADQAVAHTVVGGVPAVFVIFRKETPKQGQPNDRFDAATAVSAERAREMAMALWNAAESVDRMNAQQEGVN